MSKLKDVVNPHTLKSYYFQVTGIYTYSLVSKFILLISIKFQIIAAIYNFGPMTIPWPTNLKIDFFFQCFCTTLYCEKPFLNKQVFREHELKSDFFILAFYTFWGEVLLIKIRTPPQNKGASCCSWKRGDFPKILRIVRIEILAISLCKIAQLSISRSTCNAVLSIELKRFKK